MKVKLVPLLFLSLFSSFIVCSQNISIDPLNGAYFEMEYGCITSSSTYEIDFMAYKVTGLVDNVVYNIDKDNNGGIFGAIDYQSKSFSFVPIYDNRWEWDNSTLSTDTIILEFSGYYSDLELGSSEWYMFAANANGYGSDRDDVSVEIVTSMYVSGLTLDCSNPVSYSLQNMPGNYASASWVIRQNGITKSSGTGTSAIANNLTDGAGEVIYTISFSCGLESIQISKEFWFGKPAMPTTNPSGYPTYQMSLNDIAAIHVTSADGASNSQYNWTVSGSIDRLSTTPNSFCTIEATSTGSGNFYITSQNTCGTSPTGGGSVYVSSGGGGQQQCIVVPNPASNFVEISIQENEKDLVNRQTKDFCYILTITNSYGEPVFTNKVYDKKINIDVSGYPKGLYYISFKNGESLITGTMIVN